MAFPGDRFFILRALTHRAPFWSSSLRFCAAQTPLLFLFFHPFLHKDALGNKQPNTYHISQEKPCFGLHTVFLWRPLVPLAAGEYLSGLSGGERISLPNRGDRLETSIFLRLLRRSHLASLALLSHTPAHLYVYIRVTLHTCNLDSSTWIYPGRCPSRVCPSALGLPTCCLLPLIQLPLCS